MFPAKIFASDKRSFEPREIERRCDLSPRSVSVAVQADEHAHSPPLVWDSLARSLTTGGFTPDTEKLRDKPQRANTLPAVAISLGNIVGTRVRLGGMNRYGVVESIDSSSGKYRVRMECRNVVMNLSGDLLQPVEPSVQNGPLETALSLSDSNFDSSSFLSDAYTPPKYTFLTQDALQQSEREWNMRDLKRRKYIEKRRQKSRLHDVPEGTESPACPWKELDAIVAQDWVSNFDTSSFGDDFPRSKRKKSMREDDDPFEVGSLFDSFAPCSEQPWDSRSNLTGVSCARSRRSKESVVDSVFGKLSSIRTASKPPPIRTVTDDFRSTRSQFSSYSVYSSMHRMDRAYFEPTENAMLDEPIFPPRRDIVSHLCQEKTR